MTMTSARRPVFDADLVKAGVSVSYVGSYKPDMQEMDPGILTRAGKIFCDSKEAVLNESGDLLIPIAEGLITADAISGDIGDMFLHKLPGRESDSEIIVFETVGIGAQDLFMAKSIYDKAVSYEVGTRWS